MASLPLGGSRGGAPEEYLVPPLALTSVQELKFISFILVFAFQQFVSAIHSSSAAFILASSGF